MTDPKELSNLTMSRKECPKCGATWINGEHRWYTGAVGSEEDLAGLVCIKLGDSQWINPMRGDETGDTWEKRMATIKGLSPDEKES